ncbi:MAG: tRNA (N(6)-L-threonylcarbamoyladenosine(37)-C(2))-methylthiotransferase MtaB [Dehalococcoidia bacterium]
MAIATHGCKLNQAESQAMGRRFAQAGCSVVDACQSADIYILNTCTVTHMADAKARQWLRAARRGSPHATIVATGCYAQRSPEALSRVVGVDLVVGNRDKARLLEWIQGRGLLEKYGSLPAPDAPAPVSGYNPTSRTRAFVKVQEGCNQFCAFCIVPFTRGREANVPIPGVVGEIRARVREGYKEVVITGPQIGSYGLYPPTLEAREDPQGCDGRLHSLVEAILEQTDVTRLRLSSIQPQDLTPRLLAAWRDPRLCRHAHMALQSGCNSLLRRMGRRYSVFEYRRAVERLREAVPDIAITTDILVGFPGEAEREYDEGHRFCREMGFAGMHVFPYSPRPGTRAEGMPNRVPQEVKKERMSQMLALARDSAARFRRSFIGRTMDVLWEEQQRLGRGMFWSGLTDNYLRVYTGDRQAGPNELTPVTLVGELENGLLGRVRAAIAMATG